MPQHLPLSVLAPPHTEASISHAKTDPQYLEDRILIAHPDTRKLHANCFGTHAWLAARRGCDVRDRELLPPELNRPNSSAVCHSRLPLDIASFQETPEFQRSHIRQMPPLTGLSRRRVISGASPLPRELLQCMFATTTLLQFVFPLLGKICKLAS